MIIVENIKDLKEKVKKIKQSNFTISFVPTMGALHKGHLSLITRAKEISDKVIVSIFVNPIQFDKKSDFNNYPITLSDDIKSLKNSKIDILYLPKLDEIYPEEFNIFVDVKNIANCLCGANRKGHFQGVVTIITKLFNQITPDKAIFGEKDYQQLYIIKNLVKNLDFPIEIISSPTYREINGLAMSSRNKRLTESERNNIAPMIYKSLIEIKEEINNNPLASTRIIKSKKDYLLKNGFSKIDYLEIRQNNLKEFNGKLEEARIFIAAYIRDIRLIDNIALIY